MKIGILTFHKSINTGAFIQCYSLVKAMQKSFPNCEIEVIDYLAESANINYTTSFFKYIFCTPTRIPAIMYIKTVALHVVTLVRNPSFLKERKKIRKIFEKCWTALPLSEDSVIGNNRKKLYRKIKDRYDIIVVGSDCVWQYSGYPFPNAYLLDDDLGAVKMSYAACAFHVNYDTADSAILEKFKSSIKQFDYIGIRDVQTEKFIQRLGIETNVHHNCDPACLLDINALPFSLEEVKKHLQLFGVDLNKPIIGVQLRNEKIAKYIYETYSDRYQIVAIRAKTEYCDVYVDDLDPFEWAQVFSQFEVTVTDFFHAAYLTVKNCVCPVVCDNKSNCFNGEVSRVEDLMNRMNLSEFYYSYSSQDIAYESIGAGIEQALKEKNSKRFMVEIEKEKKSFESFRQFVEKQIEQ